MPDPTPTPVTSDEWIVLDSDPRVSVNGKIFTEELSEEMILSSAFVSFRGEVVPPSRIMLGQDGFGLFKRFSIAFSDSDPETFQTDDRITVGYLVRTTESGEQIVPNPCPPLALEQVNVPWLVRRLNQGVPNGKGGYTDVKLDVTSYCGRLRVKKTPQNPSILTKQGVETKTFYFLVFDIGNFNGPGMDVLDSDLLVEGTNNGSGGVMEKPGGMKLNIDSVRRNDRTTQIDVSAVS